MNIILKAQTRNVDLIPIFPEDREKVDRQI